MLGGAVSRLVWLALAAVAATACHASPTPTARKYTWDSESTLSIFMKKKINTPFSTVSFMLFHEGESDGQQLVAAARSLSDAAHELRAWSDAPGDSDQARQVFYEYAAAMKLDAVQLVSALEAHDRGAAVRRFEKLREKCDSCHHFFRFGQ